MKRWVCRLFGHPIALAPTNKEKYCWCGAVNEYQHWSRLTLQQVVEQKAPIGSSWWIYHGMRTNRASVEAAEGK
jgi:hypothetical protein